MRKFLRTPRVFPIPKAHKFAKGLWASLGYGFSNAKAPRFGVLGTHLVPFSFFSNSVGVRKKLQKVRYPLCPPVLNGLPSRAPHTNAFALLAKFALRTRARFAQVRYPHLARAQCSCLRASHTLCPPCFRQVKSH